MTTHFNSSQSSFTVININNNQMKNGEKGEETEKRPQGNAEGDPVSTFDEEV